MSTGGKPRCLAEGFCTLKYSKQIVQTTSFVVSKADRKIVNLGLTRRSARLTLASTKDRADDEALRKEALHV
jgi:hypothetical protein